MGMFIHDIRNVLALLQVCQAEAKHYKYQVPTRNQMNDSTALSTIELHFRTVCLNIE